MRSYKIIAKVSRLYFSVNRTLMMNGAISLFYK